MSAVFWRVSCSSSPWYAAMYHAALVEMNSSALAAVFGVDDLRSRMPCEDFWSELAWKSLFGCYWVLRPAVDVLFRSKRGDFASGLYANESVDSLAPERFPLDDDGLDELAHRALVLEPHWGNAAWRPAAWVARNILLYGDGDDVVSVWPSGVDSSRHLDGEYPLPVDPLPDVPAGKTYGSRAVSRDAFEGVDPVATRASFEANLDAVGFVLGIPPDMSREERVRAVVWSGSTRGRRISRPSVFVERLGSAGWNESAVFEDELRAVNAWLEYVEGFWDGDGPMCDVDVARNIVVRGTGMTPPGDDVWARLLGDVVTDLA